MRNIPLNCATYYLKNDFVFRLHYKTFRTREEGPYNNYNEIITIISNYLYQLSKLTNITKVHIIAYCRGDLIDRLGELDFYANIIWNYCGKRTILHITRKQKSDLKKAVEDNPKLREYDSIQFQCDPSMLEFVNGSKRYIFNTDGTAQRISYK